MKPKSSKMKIVVLALFCAIGFAATTGAARQLLNGGQILSPDGQYIDGKFLH